MSEITRTDNIVERNSNGDVVSRSQHQASVKEEAVPFSLENYRRIVTRLVSYSDVNQSHMTADHISQTGKVLDKAVTAAALPFTAPTEGVTPVGNAISKLGPAGHIGKAIGLPASVGKIHNKLMGLFIDENTPIILSIQEFNRFGTLTRDMDNLPNVDAKSERSMFQRGYDNVVNFFFNW